MVILPDHPTPVCIRTHSADNVPYLLYDSTLQQKQNQKYNEAEAESANRLIANGHDLIWHLFQGNEE